MYIESSSSGFCSFQLRVCLVIFFSLFFPHFKCINWQFVHFKRDNERGIACAVVKMERRLKNEDKWESVTSRHVVFLFFVETFSSPVADRKSRFVLFLFCLKRADERERRRANVLLNDVSLIQWVLKFLAAIVRPSPHCARSFLWDVHLLAHSLSLSLAAIVPVPGITFQSLEAIFPLLFIITAKSPSAPERATTQREREKP